MILPNEVFNHFELVDYIDNTTQFGLYLDEMSSPPSSTGYSSKCFTEPVVIQDFPLRGKGSLVAMIKGTKSRGVVHYLSKLPRSKRLQVQEITIDLSSSMKLIAKQAFPQAIIVSDRFHVHGVHAEGMISLFGARIPPCHLAAVLHTCHLGAIAERSDVCKFVIKKLLALDLSAPLRDDTLGDGGRALRAGTWDLFN